MKFKRIIKNITPPILAKSIQSLKGGDGGDGLVGFYRQFVTPGSLCFDVGANLGNRVSAFRKIGAKVIAVEPQTFCLEKLRSKYGEDPQVTIVPKALGEVPGTAELHIGSQHVLSSMSEDFRRLTTSSGRFANRKWDTSVTVEVTTLDELIKLHGMPVFIKIDVEGFESKVLAGLSMAVPAVSLEWTPEMPQSMLDCINRLKSIGNYEFNYSWGECLRLSLKTWTSPERMSQIVEAMSEESVWFGDIYARLAGK